MKHLLRRFRQEIRLRKDIEPNSTVILTNNEERKNNVLATELLLKDVFKDRITINKASTGILCGSREEAAANRLQAYTHNKDANNDLLLSSLTKNEIETFLKEKTGKNLEVFVPDTVEVRFIEQLADRWDDVRYGL